MKEEIIMETTKDKLISKLLDYASHAISLSSIADYLEIEDDSILCDILSDFQRDWNGLECDADGFNTDQEMIADKLLNEVADEIIELLN